MATITLTLSREMKDYLDEQSHQEGFQSIEACALEILKTHRTHQLKKKMVAKMIREGLESPSFVMTQKHWDKLDQTIAQASRKNGKATKNNAKGVSHLFRLAGH